MKKLKIFSAALVGAATLISGCSDTNVIEKPVNSAEILELLNPRSDLGFTSSAAKGANDFAFAFSAELAKQSMEENSDFVCSPFSVWLPLAALLNATAEPQRDELLTVLGVSELDTDTVNKAASRMLYDLMNENEKNYDGGVYHNPLKIANAVFASKNRTLNSGFAQVFADYYRGSFFGVDFASPEAVDAVNKWASDNTEGLIDNIISEFDPYTIAVIANATYFSDTWSWEFDENETRDGLFRSPASETMVKFMIREGGQTYYEDDRIQAVPMHFINGGGLYIILPKEESAFDVLTSMTGERFDEIQRKSEYSTGKLLLPRFTADSGIMNIKDTLKQMGVPLFDEETAPLTAGLFEDDTPVWASGAVQKALIEVDEKGTTAAAVTLIIATETAAPQPQPEEPFEMICDKPFMFVLYENTHDGGSQVLFTGIINSP